MRLILTAVGIFAILAIIAIMAVAAHWGPEARARAQIALDRQQAAEGRRAAVFADVRATLAATLRVVFWAGAILAIMLAFSASVTACAHAYRKARAAVALSPWATLPQLPILLPGLAYDPRTGAVDSLTEPHTGDNARPLALAEGDAARIAAVGAALHPPPLPAISTQQPAPIPCKES